MFCLDLIISIYDTKLEHCALSCLNSEVQLHKFGFFKTNQHARGRPRP